MHKSAKQSKKVLLQVLRKPALEEAETVATIFGTCSENNSQ